LEKNYNTKKVWKTFEDAARRPRREKTNGGGGRRPTMNMNMQPVVFVVVITILHSINIVYNLYFSV
jgi:hypothetical protein